MFGTRRTALALMFTCLTAFLAEAQAPYLATGLKTGEVTDTSAIVWVRLSKNEERVDFGAPMPKVRYRDEETGELLDRPRGRTWPNPVVEWPEGGTIDTIEGAVPGSPGAVTVHYRPGGEKRWFSTRPQLVNPETDFTTQFELTGLNSDTRYELRVTAQSENLLKANPQNDPGVLERNEILGAFRTAPAADDVKEISFTVTTGQRYPHRDSEDGFKIYNLMRGLNPHFFVHTGDILYYDDLGKTPALARWHWQRTYSLPSLVRFHNYYASYFMKDDHDTLVNDCWPTMESPYMGEMTFVHGLQIFREQVPMGDLTYRTARWGKDLQVWLVEGRDYRSANDMEDGPQKSIWGREQMEWFQRTVKESDATFKVLISPTPVVGPDRTNKNDNHANEGFTYEGDLLRQFIASQKNMVVVCGDRHWQYVSKDSATGIIEFSCGPASDEHAGGWSNDQKEPEHLYLNVIGGVLEMRVKREEGKPVLIGRHFGVDGKVLNEHRIEAK